jgi:polyisoprenyl-phosphate glycosyltransferase
MIQTELFVSVVVPLHNDMDILEDFLAELMTVLSGHYANYEVVLVDDGSSDRTYDIAERQLRRYPALRVLRLSRRFGQEVAISAGLDSVIGDFTVVMLPDTDPPIHIPPMVARSQIGCGVVFGVRASRKHDPWWNRRGSAAFYWVCNSLLAMNLPTESTHFRVMTRQAVNAIIRIKDPARYLQTLSAYVGYGSQSFPYELVQRRPKQRYKTPFEAVRLALDIIVSNTTRPLRLVSYGGLVLSGIYLFYIGYTFLVYALKSRVAEGWLTLSGQAAVAYFFLFLMLTILTEYVGRLLGQTHDRPLYFVAEERNSPAMILDENRRNVVEQSWIGGER